MGGHIAFMFADIPPALALIRAGKLRALGVTTGERVPVLSEVPPLKDVGMPGFDASSWHTIAIHSGVPRDIIEKLAAAIREGMAEPAVAEVLARDGAIPVVSWPAMARFPWCRRRSTSSAALSTAKPCAGAR
jgi:tripartite-type tricarboxylate transporter receptor subunit TctC